MMGQRPRRVGAEAGAAAGIKTLDAAEQQDRGFAHQVLHRLLRAGETFGHGDDQPQVRQGDPVADGCRPRRQWA